MTVQQLINELNKFPKDLEVSITDGWNGYCYTTDNIEIKIFEDIPNQNLVDIGIGGCDISHKIGERP